MKYSFLISIFLLLSLSLSAQETHSNDFSTSELKKEIQLFLEPDYEGFEITEVFSKTDNKKCNPPEK